MQALVEVAVADMPVVGVADMPVVVVAVEDVIRVRQIGFWVP